MLLVVVLSEAMRASGLAFHNTAEGKLPRRMKRIILLENATCQ